MIIIWVKAVKMFFRHSRLLVIQLWVSDASVDVNSQPPHPFSVSLSALSLEVCVCIAHMAGHKTHMRSVQRYTPIPPGAAPRTC